MKIGYVEIAAVGGGKNRAWVLGGDGVVCPSIGVRFRGAADIGRRSGRPCNQSF
jgi:hypothetical protein